MKRNSLVKIITFILVFGLAGAFYLFINTPSSIIISQSFSIAKGESIASISSRLKQENFIYSDLIFRFYLKMINKAQDIKAGYYLLPARATIKNIVQMVTDNHVLTDGNFLIKEGETLKEIENNLQQKGILLSSQNLNRWQIKDFSSEYSVLFQGIAPDNSLEGYLFPDSYHFPQGLSSSEIIEAFLTNFEAKLNDAKLLEINNGHSFYENLIIASILEKEVQTEIDKRMVADILWRRLKENFPLQVDATICYAQTQGFIDCQLTKEAFKIDSQYNTYLYKGLPPSPICNPGLESIKAALNPLSNQSWYYLTDRKTGKTIYSETYEDHLKMRQKYL
jgi:UPF0755 protein